MATATNRVYPSTVDEQMNVAATVHGISKDELIRGVHYGKEAPYGVGFPEDFIGYTSIHIIDAPADGINDGNLFVTYFQKDDTDPVELYKAVNADPDTIEQLTSGTEFDLAESHKLNKAQ
jgi:hypothetical protein